MYGYIIEKQIGRDMVKDLGHITSLVENINNVHHLLSKLFGVKDVECWRSKHNILYYVEFKSGYRLHIKSDIEIDKNEVAANNFKIISEFEYDFKDGDTIDVEILISPFRKKTGDTKRTYISEVNERIDWVKHKFESSDDICEVVCIEEGDVYQTYMCHDVREKGETALFGRDYCMKLKVKDADALKRVMCAGIGSEKNYGFGMARVC